MTVISTPALPPNNDTYSQAVRMGGFVFVSGQLGMDPATRTLVPGGIAAETRQAIENLRTILEAAGSGLEHVARVNIFITRFDDLAAMNQIYGPAFPHRPAKTTVELSRLDKGACIEMEVIAAAPLE